MVDVVSVTIAHSLDAAEVGDLGLVPSALLPGDVVSMPLDAARRLYTAGYIERTVSLADLLGGAQPAVVSPSLRTFVSDDPPTVSAGTPYVWFQTGTGLDGTGTTIWIEDGAS